MTPLLAALAAALILSGLILGVAFAVIMIVSRRRTGSMPSSGRQVGANTVLAIDATPSESTRAVAPDRRMDLAVTRA